MRSLIDDTLLAIEHVNNFYYYPWLPNNTAIAIILSELQRSSSLSGKKRLITINLDQLCSIHFLFWDCTTWMTILYCQCCRRPLLIHDILEGAWLMSGSDEGLRESDLWTFDNVEDVERCNCSRSLVWNRCRCCMWWNCSSLVAELITLSPWSLVPFSLTCIYILPEAVRFGWSLLNLNDGTVFNRVFNISKAALCWGSNIRRPYKVVNNHI